MEQADARTPGEEYFMPNLVRRYDNHGLAGVADAVEARQRVVHPLDAGLGRVLARVQQVLVLVAHLPVLHNRVRLAAEGEFCVSLIFFV